jgi:hypothetical protein
MSLVHVALLPLLFDNDVLSILIGGVEPRTHLREAAGVRVGLTAALAQSNMGSDTRDPLGIARKPESDITAISRIRTAGSFRLIHIDEYR